MARAKKNKESEAKRLQVAALPYRSGKELEVLLVSSRDTGRWIIPKGWPMRGRSSSEAAAREAFEEAGVRGEIGKKPIGSFEYDKRRPRGKPWRCLVEVYSLKVTKLYSKWPEKRQREQQWLAWKKAADMADDKELGEIIRRFAKQQ